MQISLLADKIKKHKKELIIMSIAFVLIFIAHFFITMYQADDEVFSSVPVSQFFDFEKARYTGWTSRILIDIVLMFLFKLPTFILFFFETAIIIGLVYTLSYLFTSNTLKNKLIILALIFIFPFGIMREVGWFTTMANYVWPFIFGMYAMIPIKNILLNRKEKCGWMRYPFYVLSLIFACNQEQMCALVLALYLIFFVYLLIKRKKFSAFMLLQIILAVYGVVFILICPGNYARIVHHITDSDNYYYNLNYPELSLIQKILLCVNSTMTYFLLNPNLIIILFLVMIPIMLIKDKIWVRVISFFPLGAMCIFYNSYYSFYNGNLYEIMNLFQEYWNDINDFSVSSISLFILFIVLIVIISICMFFIGKKISREMKWFLPLVFWSGFGSRMIMMFSPSVIKSGLRTHVFLYFSLIIILIIVICNICLREKSNDNNKTSREKLILSNQVEDRNSEQVIQENKIEK